MPIPSPTPPIDYKALVHDETINYYELILHGLYSAAYAMLSPDRQAHMSLTEFESNYNYTLSQACWKDNGLTDVMQLDNTTWAVAMKLSQVSCDDSTPMAYFSWSFRWQMQQNHLVIIAIGLYPTASGN